MCLYGLTFPDSTRVCALPDAPDPPDFDPSVSAMKIYSDFLKNRPKRFTGTKVATKSSSTDENFCVFFCKLV